MSPYRNEPESHDVRVVQMEADVAQSRERLGDMELIRQFVDPERLKKLEEIEAAALAENDVHRKLQALDRHKMAIDGFVSYLRQLEQALRKPSTQRIAAPLRAPEPGRELPQLKEEQEALEELLAERTTSLVFEHGSEPRMEGGADASRLQLAAGAPGQGRPLLCVQVRMVYRGIPMLLRQAAPTRSGRWGLGVLLRCRVALGLGELRISEKPSKGFFDKAFGKKDDKATGDDPFDERFTVVGDQETIRRALSPVQRRQLGALHQIDPQVALTLAQGNATLIMPRARAVEVADDALPLLAHIHGLDGSRELLTKLG